MPCVSNSNIDARIQNIYYNHRPTTTNYNEVFVEQMCETKQHAYFYLHEVNESLFVCGEMSGHVSIEAEGYQVCMVVMGLAVPFDFEA